ncbi:hypothetical protein OE88DRAFT_549862 [Heliocybe sulcata]|uniref:Uncharacterized protein n=1 Tax=Heliocybe sulcata TaxID=5364 RepID=A0A5C3N322_9AGAM|nr:hypothetical protein OE88DRAFT_549862 [Heliocybe sulcata]
MSAGNSPRIRPGANVVPSSTRICSPVAFRVVVFTALISATACNLGLDPGPWTLDPCPRIYTEPYSRQARYLASWNLVCLFANSPITVLCSGALRSACISPRGHR